MSLQTPLRFSLLTQMDSALALSSTILPFHESNRNLHLPSGPFSLSFKTLLKPSSRISITAKVLCNFNINPLNGFNKETQFAQTLQTAAKTVVLTVAATVMVFKLKEMPAKAKPFTSPVEEEKVDNLSESNSEFVDNLWKLLQKKLENRKDKEALKILDKLVEAQPSEMEWKFLRAWVLGEMGKTQEARQAFEEILALNPLSYEALFENAVLMDSCGEGNAVIVRLEKALSIAMDENRAKEARDVRFIIAQNQLMQKNVEEALKSFEELSKEDPKDFRPYYFKGMIYILLGRNAESREEFEKCKALSPKNFGVEGSSRTPLSRTMPFGKDSQS